MERAAPIAPKYRDNILENKIFRTATIIYTSA